MLDIITHNGGILEIRLARPPANALDGELLIALRDAVASAPANGARGIIVSGAPGMFSAGLDLPALLECDRATMRVFWSDFVAMMRALAGSALPVAAAITGHSPAGGAVIALCCDYRVMAAGNFKIGLNEVRVGLPLPAILYDALTNVVGPRQAALLGAEGRLLDAHQALAAGLVDELAPPEETVAAARAWLDGVLALPPVAYAQTRARTRSALVDAFAVAAAAPAIEAIVDAWFSDETQAQLRFVVGQLKAKKR
jgi:enoyl-CoA hydratase/carnithine racemase